MWTIGSPASPPLRSRVKLVDLRLAMPDARAGKLLSSADLLLVPQDSTQIKSQDSGETCQVKALKANWTQLTAG